MQVIIDDHVCEQHPLTTPCFSVMHLRTPGQSQPVAALLPCGVTTTPRAVLPTYLPVARDSQHLLS